MRKDLRLFDIFCLGLNAIVGSGIFLFPGLLAGYAGPASILVFPICGLLLIPIALCFSWLASRYEGTGGTYLYAREAFGPWVAYSVGWISWITQALSFAAVSNAIAVYLGHFSPQLDSVWVVKSVAGTVIIGWGILNYRGIKMAARTADFFTIAKLTPLLIFVAAGIFALQGGNFKPFTPHGWAPMSSAVFLAFFAFMGFENVTVPGGEAKLPKKDMPIAATGSLLVAMLVYSLIQLVAVGTYPNLAGSAKPLAEAAVLFLGPLAALVAAGAAISTFGYTSGAAIIVPRYLYALADSKRFPKYVEAVHDRFQTPHHAIVISTIFVFIAALFLDFQKLVDLSIVTTTVQYFVTCAAAFKFQRLENNAITPPPPGCASSKALPDVQPGGGGVKTWRLPLGIFAPIIGMAVSVYISLQATRQEILISLGLLAFGLVLGAIYRHRQARA